MKTCGEHASRLSAVEVVECVRLSAERAIAAQIARETEALRVPPLVVETATQRRFLLSHALLLTRTMAPEAYAAADIAAEALGCAKPIELFLARDRGEGRRARLVLHGADVVGIELAGDCLATHSAQELVAILGHEIGHHLAHSTQPELARIATVLPGASAKSRRIWSLATELTADRLGLLACRDLDVVLRLEMRGAMALVPSLVLDTVAYREQCRAIGEDLVASKRIMFGQTHPEHYVRGWAAMLFEESDVYRALTGRGSGERSLAEVDDVLAGLLGLGG